MKTRKRIQNPVFANIIRGRMKQIKFNEEFSEIREEQNIRDSMIVRDLQEYRYKAVNFHSY
jgi:hypothetical protein